MSNHTPRLAFIRLNAARNFNWAMRDTIIPLNDTEFRSAAGVTEVWRNDERIAISSESLDVIAGKINSLDQAEVTAK